MKRVLLLAIICATLFVQACHSPSFRERLGSTRKELLEDVASQDTTFWDSISVVIGQKRVLNACVECTQAWVKSGVFDKAWNAAEAIFPGASQKVVFERGSGDEPYSPYYLLNVMYQTEDRFGLVEVSSHIGSRVSCRSCNLSAERGEALLMEIAERVKDVGKRFNFGNHTPDHCCCAFIHVMDEDLHNVEFCSSIRDEELAAYLDSVLNPCDL